MVRKTSEKIPDGKRITIGLVILFCLWALFSVFSQKEEITVYTSRASKQKYGDLVKAVENVRGAKVNVKTFDTLFKKTSQEQQIKPTVRNTRSDENLTLESLLNGGAPDVVIDRLLSFDGKLPAELLISLKKALSGNKISEVKKLFIELAEKTDSKKVLGEIAFQQCIVARDKYQYNEAFEYCQDAIKYAPKNAIYLVANGDITYKLKNYNKALVYHEQALSIFTSTLGVDTPYVAEMKMYIASSLSSLGKVEKAIELNEQALVGNIKNYGKNHWLVAETYKRLGIEWLMFGDFKKATDYLAKSLTLYLELFGENNRMVGQIYYWQGTLYSKLAESKKALAYYNYALAIYKKQVPIEDPGFVYQYQNVGIAMQNIGEYEKALGVFKQGLALEARYRGRNSLIFGLLHNNIGACWRKLNKPDKSIFHQKKALAIAMEFCAGDPCLLLVSVNSEFGGAYFALEKFDMAISYYEKALIEGRKYFGENHIKVGVIYYNIATILVDMKEYQKAEKYSKKALTICMNTLGVAHPITRQIKKSHINIGSRITAIRTQ